MTDKLMPKIEKKYADKIIRLIKICPIENGSDYYKSLFNSPIAVVVKFEDLADGSIIKFYKKIKDNFKIVDIENYFYVGKTRKMKQHAFVGVDFKNKILITRGGWNKMRLILGGDYSKEVLEQYIDLSKGHFKKPVKRKKKGNVYILSVKGSGMNVSINFNPFKISKFDIDVNKNYNDDFKEVHDTIIPKLKSKQENGIVILHGKAGTGKTYNIRHLINILGKKILYIPPSMVNWINDPFFLRILGKHKDSVLLIEDADNVLRKRDMMLDSQNASSLLNITDGLLTDILQLKIVATFNTNLKNIDEAFLRNGRLIARYEFKELEQQKAQILSDSLGFQSEIKKDMTLTDIYNQENGKIDNTQQSRIGYKINEK